MLSNAVVLFVYSYTSVKLVLFKVFAVVFVYYYISVKFAVLFKSVVLFVYFYYTSVKLVLVNVSYSTSVKFVVLFSSFVVFVSSYYISVKSAVFFNVLCTVVYDCFLVSFFPFSCLEVPFVLLFSFTALWVIVSLSLDLFLILFPPSWTLFSLFSFSSIVILLIFWVLTTFFPVLLPNFTFYCIFSSSNFLIVILP